MDDIPPHLDPEVRDRFVAEYSRLLAQIIQAEVNPADGPSTLYHYTSAAGLKGILTEGHLYVSRAACLNDPRELSYGEDLAGEVIRDRELRAAAGPNKGLVRLFHQNALQLLGRAGGAWEKTWLGGRMRHDPFVACFCEQPDLLGQWAYFARDGGYNVGFRRAQLTAVVGPDGYALSRVIYDPADQRKILVSAVEQFENLVATQLGSVNSPLQMAGAASSAAALVIAVRNLAIGMKAPGFEPEKEWRLVTFASEGSGIDGDPDGVEDAKNMAFRTVGGRIVPYFKAAYGPGGPPVVSITIGPTVDAEIAKDSITRILKGRGYRWREIEVQASKITLRE